MTETTTRKIKAFSRDDMQTDAFNALLDYYGKSSLGNISEEMGLNFLAKLESGEIRLYDNLTSLGNLFQEKRDNVENE